MNLFVILFSLVAIATLSYQQSDDCPAMKFVNKTKDGKPRLTMLQMGNYTIQVMLQFSQTDSNCQNVSLNGLIQMYAIQFAIDKFNSNPIYNRSFTIGLQLDDDCGQLPTTMARGIEIVSLYRNNSVCRSDFLSCGESREPEIRELIKKASAVIGTSFSFTSIPLSSLMSLYDIPQVSPSASSRLLSKRELYKSFFRTIPSDTNQITVMIEMFKRFDWNYIFAIGSDDDYGKLGISELKQKLSNKDICIYKDEYIPYQSSTTATKIEEVIKKIKARSTAKVVVLFLYVDIGRQILKRAQEEGIERIWVTSEAWNPAAVTTFNQPEYNFPSQTHGIISVSLKRYKLEILIDFIRKQITNDYKCNNWLKQYILNAHGCQLDSYDYDKKAFECSNTNPLSLEKILNDIRDNQPGFLQNLIDAATALSLSMHQAMEKKCGNSSDCSSLTLTPDEVTKKMEEVKFENEQNKTISFSLGDPTNVLYTIENLVQKNGTLVYAEVGNWTTTNGLVLNKDLIHWPRWFNASLDQPAGSHPSSMCYEKCKPGWKVVGRDSCCWTCQKCLGNNYSDHEMATECLSCGSEHHTLDNINCTLTPVKWLNIEDSTGMAIVIVSVIGFLATLLATVFICRYRNFVSIHDTSPHMMTVTCVILFLTFIYGPLHVIKPTDALCKVRNSYFFLLLMLYSSFVLVKTQAMTSYLRGRADKSFGGKLLIAQLIVLLLFFLLEVVSVVAWLTVDGDQVEKFENTLEHSILLQCQVDFTAARLVSTFIPCIILIIATFCAFRERNADHSFYEPKFLSFSCIALCIIIVAFLPTFRYVVGIYKAIVLAFTMNVFGYTFMACLILPKVYVGVMRKRKGINEYPMKPGTNKRKSKKKNANKKKNKHDDIMGVIDSSVVETTKTKSTVNEPSELVDGMDLSSINGEDEDQRKLHSNGLNGTNQTMDINPVGYANVNGISPETTKV